MPEQKIDKRMLLSDLSGVRAREAFDIGRILKAQPAPPGPPSPPLLPQPPPVGIPAPPQVPAPAGTNPFAALPFRSPGDRIKSDDFNALSQSLKTIYDMSLISSSLFGVSFGQAKLVLTSQQYVIQRVMTVFGTEIDNLADTSLDNRKVVQVLMVPGERQVSVVVTEAVETRRFAPNLLGLTYREGSERLQALLGEITFPTTPINASQLIGLSLKEASQTISK